MFHASILTSQVITESDDEEHGEKEEEKQEETNSVAIAIIVSCSGTAFVVVLVVSGLVCFNTRAGRKNKLGQTHTTDTGTNIL